MKASNDTVALTPTIAMGGRQLLYDFPAIRVGAAEYPEGPTGCTVIAFPKAAFTIADVRGGASATLFTEQMRDDSLPLNAICLAGGSFYGLEAATGVAAELFAQRDFSTHWGDIALVSGAIIFDYGPRDNAIYPDKALGRSAMRAAQAGSFPLGPRGAGCSATVGKAFGFEEMEHAGQGGAFRQVGPTKVAVFTVVNAVGAIVDRQGRVVRGYRDRASGEHPRYEDRIARALEASGPAPTVSGNTTLTVVVTNQRLGSHLHRQFARQVHDSMTRAIQPFHAPNDGDTLYAVTTQEVDNPALSETLLGALASEVAWDAVLSCFDA
jgi:L-aminopeptidase/D-esterase-like protein